MLDEEPINKVGTGFIKELLDSLGVNVAEGLPLMRSEYDIELESGQLIGVRTTGLDRDMYSFTDILPSLKYDYLIVLGLSAGLFKYKIGRCL